MPLYANIDGAKREVTQLYANIGGAKKMLSEMNGNIGGAKKKIFSKYYTWAKYISYQSGFEYGNYHVSSTIREKDLGIWPPYEKAGITVYDSEVGGVKYYNFIYGTDFYYSNSNGSFSLLGKKTYSLNTSMSTNNYTIEHEFIGKYVYDADEECIYEITGHDDVHLLHLGKSRFRGILHYKYQFKYDSDVTSTDPNAYTSGSIASYTSTSSNDIRTVYVKK